MLTTLRAKSISDDATSSTDTSEKRISVSPPFRRVLVPRTTKRYAPGPKSLPREKKPRRVPAGKTDCGTPQRTSRTPLTPDLHHHPIHVDLRWPAHTPTGEGRPALSPERTAREHSPPCQGMHAAEDEETNSPGGLPLMFERVEDRT